MTQRGAVGGLAPAWKLTLLLLPPLVALLTLGVGRMFISPMEVLQSLAAKLTGGEALAAQMETVLWSIRLPRILLALLAGAGLSAAGCAFQSLFANPLATPDTLGVASGASFGAALALLLGFGLVGVQGLSLAFGILAVALTWLTGGTRGTGLSGTVLAGIMIGSLFSALVSLIKFVADPESQLPSITYWLMGSLSAAGYRTLALGAPLIVLGVLVLFLLRWRLNLLPLSEDETRATGVNVRVLRGITVLCATAITASCVSMCGQVGWVGLLVPHVCRMKFGNNHLAVLPASISLGAVFLLLVDTLARSATAAEIPISILTAILGAPFFIMLMRKSGGWQL